MTAGGLPTPQASVLETDEARRRRAAFVLSSGIAAGGYALALINALPAEPTPRLAPLTAALATVAAGLAWLARRGWPGVAGAVLSALPTAGALVGVLVTGRAGAAAYFPALGMLIAIATLRGRALVVMMATALASALGIVALSAALDFPPVPAEQILRNAVVFVVLCALVGGVHVSGHQWVLERLRLEQEAARAAEARARESDERHRLFADNLVDLLALLSFDGQVVYASPSYQRVLGITPTQGGLDAMRPAIAAEEDRQRLVEAFGAATAGKVARCDARLKRADGSVGWFDCLFGPVPGKPLIVAVSRDVSETRALSEQLQQSQKMDALGRFAGSIAHDFNNLLSIMQTCTALALDSLPPDASARGELADVRQAVERAAELTGQLLSFSRRKVVVPQRIDVRASLLGNLELVRRLLGTGISVEVSCPEDTWPLWAGPSQLEQIVMNLAVNARDAMPRGGTLSVRAGNHVDPELGEVVRLSVRDSGTGMDEETRRHLFEPFFTTKPTGSGTGLGLATVFGIVQALGGRVEVESAPGQGSEFLLLLPRLRAAHEAIPTPPPTRGALPEIPQVAVVDDDADVRATMVRVLTQAGYQVVATGSAEALLELASRMGRLDVLVTDVGLPGLDGLGLARRLLDGNPGLDVVITSGDSPNPADIARFIARGARFLPKPFAAQQLLAAVRRPVPPAAAGARPKQPGTRA